MYVPLRGFCFIINKWLKCHSKLSFYVAVFVPHPSSYTGKEKGYWHHIAGRARTSYTETRLHNYPLPDFLIFLAIVH